MREVCLKDKSQLAGLIGQTTYNWAPKMNNGVIDYNTESKKQIHKTIITFKEKGWEEEVNKNNN